MKAEINNQNKAKFFALYWDQNVLSSSMYGDGGTIYSLTMKVDSHDKKWLSLKPLSQISDEDVIKLSELMGENFDGFEHTEIPNEEIIEFRNEIVEVFEEIHYPLIVSDYLRSRGYALPWMGISVEEMIEAGWIKLTES